MSAVLHPAGRSSAPDDGRVRAAADTRPRRRARALAAVAATVTVLASLSLLVVTPWQRRWGATDAELARTMPGDAIVRAAGGRLDSTEAITVDAPAERIWPWLVQMGVGRGGFYTLTWVENLLGLGVTNADRIVPEWQRLRVGDVVGIRSATEGARVAVLEVGSALVLVDEPTPGYITTWDFGLYPGDGARTRLVVRRGGTSPGAAGRVFNALMEPGFFVMDRAMLKGIKARAEGAP
jgi:hypothetical protein